MKRVIDIAEEINNPSALTQEQGDVIYEIIADAFEKKEKIILDFVNVESMISPFLNNAIGQLYGKYTSEEITQYLQLENFPKSKVSTLNIVINNAKKYYANKEDYKKLVKDVVDIG